MSEDPTQVDSATLCASIRRDISTCRGKLVDAWRLLDMAVVAVWELENRAVKAQADKEPPHA